MMPGIATLLPPLYLPRLPPWMQGVVEYWRSGGPVMAAIALVTLLFWYRYFSTLACLHEMLLYADAEATAEPPDHLQSDTVPLEKVRGAIPRVVVRVRRARRQGMPLADAFEEARAAETGFCSWAFYVMGALVTVAPLLGLLGTVVGMVTTFRAVAGGSEGGGHDVAMGISQALITTQAGLVSALAGTFGLAHVHRLYRRLQHALDRLYYHLALGARRQRDRLSGRTADAPADARPDPHGGTPQHDAIPADSGRDE